MADDDKESKTQDPTQKRLDDALEKGDVAKSQEVNTWFVIGASTLLLSSFSGSISSSSVCWTCTHCAESKMHSNTE